MMGLRRQLCPRQVMYLRHLTTGPVAAPAPAPPSGGRKKREVEKHGPDLAHFLQKVGAPTSSKVYPAPPPYIDPATLRGGGAKVFLDIYGCQMNVSDAEVVLGILQEHGYERTLSKEEADIWLIVTCSIREGAEDKIWRKLRHIEQARKQRKRTNPAALPQVKESVVVGVLGCMAERVKAGLLGEGLASVVAGPDSYRDLPRLLATQRLTGQAAINVLLSLQETYSGVTPVRLNNSVSAFVSIQRGCDNMCSYCIVPFTRGRERSRPVASVLEEVALLREAGVREVTLLGQNVNSYRDTSRQTEQLFPAVSPGQGTVAGFSTVYKQKQGGFRFAHLLDQVSAANPDMRIRFTSPHPKDFPGEVLDMIADRPNICRVLHLPAQSGSTRVLAAMGRGYSREAYLALVQAARERLPGLAITSDFITGFCGETEEDFRQTLDLVKMVGYHKCFMFPYSMREKTGAHRRLEDSVPHEVKAERHLRLKEVFVEGVKALHSCYHSTVQAVLVTGDSRRSADDLQGLADCGTKVIFPKTPENCPRPGQTVDVEITASSSEVLKGRVYRQSC